MSNGLCQKVFKLDVGLDPSMGTSEDGIAVCVETRATESTTLPKSKCGFGSM
jgi:hypothetical protein